jgi:hypothetical protein
MDLQYLSNQKGKIVAVQMPIKEWDLLKSKYPELDSAPKDADLTPFELPNWQKELIDARLDAMAKNPECILPIDSLIAELDDDLD